MLHLKTLRIFYSFQSSRKQRQYWSVSLPFFSLLTQQRPGDDGISLRAKLGKYVRASFFSASTINVTYNKLWCLQYTPARSPEICSWFTGNYERKDGDPKALKALPSLLPNYNCKLLLRYRCYPSLENVSKFPNILWDQHSPDLVAFTHGMTRTISRLTHGPMNVSMEQCRSESKIRRWIVHRHHLLHIRVKIPLTLVLKNPCAGRQASASIPMIIWV